MKKLFVTGCMLLTGWRGQAIMACEVCRKNQPELLEDITHGTGPQGNLDYVIGWSAVFIVAVTFFLSLKFLVRPNENSPGHIKNSIIE